MYLKSVFLSAVICIAMGLSGCGSQHAEPLRFYAGAGLRNAVEDLCGAFEQKTGIAVDVDYAGSGVILARVQEDPEADLFMPGDVWYVERLNELTGSVEEAIPVARLIPVLIVAKGNPKKITGLEDLARPDIKAALGSPKACQIGRLCERILQRTGLDWPAIADQESLTVNELAVWVKMNAADVAIVWDSTAASVAENVEVMALDLKPDEISSVVCAQISTSARPEEARAFMRFMAGPEGQRIFRANGFSGKDDYGLQNNERQND